MQRNARIQVQQRAGQEVKPAACILCTYVGFIAGSLQAMALPDKWEGLGVVLLVTIILVIAGMVHTRGKRKPGKVKTNKAIPRRSSARKRSAVKSKMKVVKS